MSIHINAPKGTYVAQVRKSGKKTWDKLSIHAELKDAAVAVAAKLAESEYYQKGRVIFMAEYYDPSVCMTLET